MGTVIIELEAVEGGFGASPFDICLVRIIKVSNRNIFTVTLSINGQQMYQSGSLPSLQDAVFQGILIMLGENYPKFRVNTVRDERNNS